MSGRLDIFIPALPPAALSPNARVHFQERAAAAREYGMVVRAALHAQTRPPLPRLARAVLGYTFLLPRNRAQWQDLDNLTAGMKAGLDVLVQAGVLPDDGPEHLGGLVAAWQTAPDGRTGVRLTLWEAGE